MRHSTKSLAEVEVVTIQCSPLNHPGRISADLTNINCQKWPVSLSLHLSLTISSNYVKEKLAIEDKIHLSFRPKVTLLAPTYIFF